VEDDKTYVSFQEIFEDYCLKAGLKKDDPIIFYIEKMKDVFLSADITKRGVFLYNSRK
jgi:transformation/transcription domain-associated protein